MSLPRGRLLSRNGAPPSDTGTAVFVPKLPQMWPQFWDHILVPKMGPPFLHMKGGPDSGPIFWARNGGQKMAQKRSRNCVHELWQAALLMQLHHVRVTWHAHARTMNKRTLSGAMPQVKNNAGLPMPCSGPPVSPSAGLPTHGCSRHLGLMPDSLARHDGWHWKQSICISR
jgi:hypothetical protein